jgi:ATP-binding protein involved in chromosome partitioning
MADNIKNLILVASGKGGVGKSTVAVNLALALSQSGYATGLLDADVYGPSIPTMLGPSGKPGTDGKHLFPIEKHGLKLISMGYLVDPEVAMIWRGPMLASAATQFVTDVEWGELDYLVLDLPPGTGDIQLTLAQKFKVTGAVLVSTPQEVALADVRRAKTMFDKVHINTIGLVENMSYFICPNCDARHEIFSHGGAERAAQQMGIDFLGRVPLEPKVREGGDAGTPVLLTAPDSASSKAFKEIAAALDERAQRIYQERTKAEGKRRILPIVQS